MKVEAQRIIRTQNLDETPMNHVEAARSSCGISPNVRGMWGIVRYVLVNVMSNGFQTCFSAAHLHQSLRRNFCQTYCRRPLGWPEGFDQRPK